MRRPLADLFPDFITFCCNIMALIAFQLVTTIYWVVLGDALTKSGNIAIFTPATTVATQNIAIFIPTTTAATPRRPFKIQIVMLIMIKIIEKVYRI